MVSVVGRRSEEVLFVANLLHPVDDLAVQLFLDGDVGHCCGLCGAVPMFVPRRTPDEITRPDFLNRATPTLCPAAARDHNQGLAQRVRMPCSASTGFEGDTG